MFILLLTSGWCYADCPLFTYPENHKLDQEINNICQNQQNPVFGTATGSTMTVTQLNVSTITVKGKIQFPDGTSQTSAAASSGRLMKIITSSTTASTTSVGTSYTLTTTTATINMASSTDKVKITVNCDLDNLVPATNGSFASLFKNGADIGPPSGNGLCASADSGTTFSGLRNHCSIVYWDTPGTTAPTSYAVYIKSTSGADSIWNTDNTLCVEIIEDYSLPTGT